MLLIDSKKNKIIVEYRHYEKRKKSEDRAVKSRGDVGEGRRTLLTTRREEDVPYTLEISKTESYLSSYNIYCYKWLKVENQIK